jgi:hypothetical protein
MAHRLEETSTEVSYTVTSGVTIGYHDCGVCGKETPRPTHDVLIEYVKAKQAEGLDGGFLWPGPDWNEWMPPGWTNDHDAGLICEDCTAAKTAAFDARRKPCPRN